ncbi:MAG TPA: outer membrane protein assembly factor BamE [Gammaproteobacteria bacterium]|nr:outer membrane protein assembly factor BamE [Gammaproteobacteria bacterium]
MLRILQVCSGLLCLLISLSACTIHRIDVQQGNIIQEQQVKKLKPGISKRQVRFIMGTPLIEDPFNANRWDYVFTMQPGNERKITKYQRITVYFEDDKLSKIAQF